MKIGAVAILDALGFKGIWKRFESDVVFQKLRDLRDVVVGEVSNANRDVPRMLFVDPISRSAKFFSDTCVICVSIESATGVVLSPDDEVSMLTQHHALRDLTLTLANFLAHAIVTFPPFAYRGCIATGPFDIDDVFLLGPAIDEAAELASVADGAFVWFSPRTQALYERFSSLIPSKVDSNFPEYHTVQNALAPIYHVPLKGGHIAESRVVNPLAPHEPDTRDVLVERLLKTFDTSREDVRRKRSQTEAFLAIARAAPHIPLGTRIPPVQ